MAIISVFGTLLDTDTGTTAPFSAMSGPVTATSLLTAKVSPPMAFSASSRVLASNMPACQSAANTSLGLSRPAVIARPRMEPMRRASRRF
ncbi:hypothetical protein D9M69_691360 [compost metagenome]